MKYSRDEYIKIFIRNINASRKIKKKIKEDISERIDIAISEDPFYNLVIEMGEPEELAQDFMENLVNKGTYVNYGFEIRISDKSYEYKSETTIFGIPLIHINTGGNHGNKVAKGIIAVGDIAFGVFAVGGIGVGVVAVGALGIGVIAIGGIALGGLAVGGIAIGVFALGGIAVGILKALGGISYLL